MKIACISTSRIPSDTANSIQVMKVCQALKQIGHAVHLLVPQAQPAGWDELSVRYGLTPPFDVTWLPAHPRLKRNDFAWLAVRRARRIGADLVYTWTGQSAVFALLLGLPVIYEMHDLPTGKLGPLWFRSFLKLGGKKRMLAVTDALRSRLESLYGPIQGGDVLIAPNGVDLEQYEGLPAPAAARRAVGLPDRVTVSCSGHLYAGRGAELFLGLARRFPEASFVWVGGRKEDVDTYRTRAEAEGLKNVRFTGFIDQQRLPCYQAAADILLMPYARSIAGSSGGNSADICSPMKMFDYLAAGRAILTSDLPVIHEVLLESNAVFAPPEDLEGWSDALARLLASEDYRLRLGAQALSDAQKYSWRERARRALLHFPSETK